MSNYYYIANDTKKEYLNCPGKHWPRLHSYLEDKSHCIRTLLIHQLLFDWNGDVISIYNDGNDLPWKDNPEWEDITIKIIDEYNNDNKIYDIPVRIRCKPIKIKKLK